MNQMCQPTIKTFLDVREYLKSYYHWRKAEAPGFSYAEWASELEISSRSYLRLVIMGKRSLTDRLVPKFVKALSLSKSDAEYFMLLVRFQTAVTLDTKEQAWQKILAQRVRSEDFLRVIDEQRFLSNPATPRLQTLLSLEGFEKTADNLSSILNLSLSETTSCLEVLERLGFATAQDCPTAKVWSTRTHFFEVPSKLGSFALQSFHKKSLADAQLALAQDPRVRDFQSLLTVLDEATYTRVTEMIKACLKSILMQAHADTQQSIEPKSLRVYQINTNLFPVSDPILQPGNSQVVPVGMFPKSPDLIPENAL